MSDSQRQQLARRALLRQGLASAGAAGIAMAGSALRDPTQAMAQEATPEAAGTTTPGITAERVAAALAQLDALAQQTLDETGIPGLAVAVVYGDNAPYLKGYGTRQIGKDLPIDADTVFQLASMSKPIASTVVAAVVGDGDATWDSQIADLLPDFQMFVPWVTNQITLRDMFCHRSGLPDHAGDHLEDLGFDRETILHRMRFIEPDSSFRSAYAYTNFGLTAAGVAAAAAAGTDWEDLAQRRLFQRLGMDHTSYRFADFMAQPDRAIPHMRIDGVWQVTREQRQPDPEAPAGGASSNVRDLGQWLKLQLGAGTFEGEEVVAAAPLGQTHVPQIAQHDPANPAVDRTSFYGLGWNVGYTDTGLVRLGHSGAFNLGAGTTVNLYPGQGLGIVVLSNAQPIGAVEALAAEFFDLAEWGTIRQDYRAIFARAFAAIMAPNYGTEVDYLAPPSDAPAALADNAYLGTYHSDLYGDAVVANDATGLVLRLGPDLTAYPLTHFERDTFWYQPTGENAYGPAGVTFTIGVTGAATSVTIENLNFNGQGSLTRVMGDG